MPADLRDRDVRDAMHAKVLRAHRQDPDTLVVDEMGVVGGEARVDIAVINGRLHGYEIKSDRDTLDRLPRQVSIYGLVFDQVTLVVGQHHEESAESIVPPWWGIAVARQGPRGGVHIKTRRRARLNRDVEPVEVAGLLWRDEALALLESRGLAKGLRSKPRRMLYEALASHLDLQTLKSEVRQTLKARSGWRSDSP